MKKYLILLFLSIFIVSFAAKAQNPTRKKLNHARYSAFFNYSWTILIPKPSNIDIRELRSMGVDFGVLGKFGKKDENKKLIFSLGMSSSFSNIFSDAKNWEYDSTIKDFQIIPNDSVYLKNKLTFVYLNVPLEIKYIFNTQKYNPFSIGFGVFLGMKIESHIKHKNEINTIKFGPIYNLNPVRYGIYIRTGTDIVSVFARYSMNKFLMKNKSNSIAHSFEIGFCFFN